MPEVFVTRKMTFNAAHRLHNPEYSDEWNRETFSKCNSPDWHGHNYVLEVTVVGEPDPATGYVCDLGKLKKVLNERVVDLVDHKNLNINVGFMHGIIPSTENFAVAIWQRLEDHLPSGRLHCVRLYETENNRAEYYGN
ncbi:MAG: 6-carboxytetrahydropterin synthase [Bacteroidota bacterium]